MELLRFLQDKKAELTKQLSFRKYLLDRYELNAYISTKTIKGKPYQYLQRRDRDGFLTSTYLSLHDQELLRRTSEEKEYYKKRIASIERDLSLLASVPCPCDGAEDCRMLPRELHHFRLLRHAVGISERFHVLFEVIPDTRPSAYMVQGTYKKREFAVPMPYVNERYIGNIKRYVESAGIAIDMSIMSDCDSTRRYFRKVLRGKTRSGVQYTAKGDGAGLRVSFVLDGEPVFIRRDDWHTGTYLDDEIARMYICSSIEEYVSKHEFDLVQKDLASF